MLERIKMWFIRFMDGRYGPDDLTRFLLITYLVLSVLNIFLGIPILYFAGFVFIFVIVFRMFSRNIEKRQAENERFLMLKKKAVTFFKRQKNRLRDIKTHRYRKCPGCRAIMRLPLKKGELNVRCRRCGQDFKVRILF